MDNELFNALLLNESMVRKYQTSIIFKLRSQEYNRKRWLEAKKR